MEYLEIAIPFALALLIVLIGMPLFLPALRKIKAGQSIREDGPKSHMKKSGTPTMGGVVIIVAVAVTCLLVTDINQDMIIILVAFIAFGALGFLDDFVKVTMKRNLGLTALHKLGLQMLIAIGIAVYQAQTSIYGTTVAIPFIDQYWDLGPFYVPFIVFVVVSMANGVNLTDGLDGLASGVTMIVALFLALVGSAFQFVSAGVFASALTGACLGFLFYNRHPAKVFMGDTGSLALGGGIATAAIIMNIELILPIAGGVYVAEALSVVLQILYFKKTGGKRLLKMAPLHHHFELSGWKESKVVAVFWLVTAVLCVIGLLGI